jgi:hypothetical protein
MRILTLSPTPNTDRSFRIGVALVAIFAAAELSSTSYYYLRRFRVTQPAARPSVVAVKPAITPSVKPVTRTTPPPAAAASPSVPAPSDTDRLVQQATTLRSQGDTTNALARLIEAAERDPKNTKVLVEMAKTYETMQLVDRATETWRKIQDMGPVGSASYDLAVARLKSGVPPPAPATVPSVAPAVRPDAPPPVQTAETPPAGSIFTIAQVKATEEPDPDTDTNLTLRIAVKKQTNTVVDHTKVKIQVFFYDTVDDKDIRLTDADVNYEWVTSKHDWAGPDPEVLAVSYVRPKNKVLSSEAALSAAAASINPGRKAKPVTSPPPESGQRRYLGYIVRVYYHDQLQATKAEPKRLLKLFPATSPASP